MSAISVLVMDGKYRVFRGGFLEYEHHETREAAIDAAFPAYAWSGGYDIVYFAADDGCTMLCADCAKQAYTADNTPFESAILEGPRASGEWCEGHNGWIVEPHCSECGTNESDLRYGRRLWFSDSDDSAYCDRCIAEAYCNGLKSTGFLMADKPEWHTYAGPHWNSRVYQTTVYAGGSAVGTFHP